MSRNLIVVDSVERWPLVLPGVEVASAREYLSNPAYSQRRGANIFNLCRSYKYQSVGYYVSLLAEARHHRPQPSIATIQDMKSQVLTRILSDDLDEQIRRALSTSRSETFALSIYFGRTLAKRHKRLGRQLFTLFQAPLLRAHFARDKDQAWELRSVGPIPASEIPESHRELVIEAASAYFSKPRAARGRKTRSPRYDIAILWDPKEKHSPSNERAIQRFIRAGSKLGLDCDAVTKDDYSRVAEFDGLFIRETTAVMHHTYRFARRASAEGLVVIDDPDSIVRCTNKVYLAEILANHRIRAPKTMIVRRDNAPLAAREIGFPCILKMPDSSFSQGVIKIETEILWLAELDRALDRSELLIVQEFLPTEYDWRIGILGGKALFACKYYMAKDHWQIIKRAIGGRARYGSVEAVPLEQVPRRVLWTALRAAKLIGDGFYGVDLKLMNNRAYVIEVNDNPNVDAGYEDGVLKEQLYLEVMRVFLDRIEKKKQGESPKRTKGRSEPQAGLAR